MVVLKSMHETSSLSLLVSGGFLDSSVELVRALHSQLLCAEPPQQTHGTTSLRRKVSALLTFELARNFFLRVSSKLGQTLVMTQGGVWKQG